MRQSSVISHQFENVEGSARVGTTNSPQSSVVSRQRWITSRSSASRYSPWRTACQSPVTSHQSSAIGRSPLPLSVEGPCLSPGLPVISPQSISHQPSVISHPPLPHLERVGAVLVAGLGGGDERAQVGHHGLRARRRALLKNIGDNDTMKLA